MEWSVVTSFFLFIIVNVMKESESCQSNNNKKVKFGTGKFLLEKVDLQTMKLISTQFSVVLTTSKADLGEKKGRIE